MSIAPFAVSSASFVSVEEYLRTAYTPDVEYIDGELKEKPMPTSLHGFVQMMIGRWFGNHMEEWGLSPESEVRTRVRASSFRLPDVSLVPIPREFSGVQSEPPSIAIEIRSEDDKAVDLENRARDLRAMGVPRVWMVDPQERRVFVWTESYWLPVEGSVLWAGKTVHLDIEWLWAQVDLREGKSPGKDAV